MPSASSIDPMKSDRELTRTLRSIRNRLEKAIPPNRNIKGEIVAVYLTREEVALLMVCIDVELV